MTRALWLRLTWITIKLAVLFSLGDTTAHLVIYQNY